MVSKYRSAGRKLPRTHGRLAICGAITAALAGAHTTRAATDTWLDTDGLFWNNTAGWVSGVLPANNDIVNIGTHSSAVSSPTLNFTSNLTSSGINLNTLDINSTGVSGIMTFSQTLSTSSMAAGSEIIGDTISGNVYAQNAGSNTATSITLGNSASGTGNYNFSGGTITAVVFIVGNNGTGAVIHSAGTANITNALVVGGQNTASGSYNLSGTGIINAVNEIMAENNTAAGVTDNFTQLGGTNNIINNGSLTIGQNGNATYSLSNGTLNQSGTGSETLGYGANGIGTLTQSGGVNNATNIQIGSAFSITGFATYNLQGGNLTVSSGNVAIGNGTFNQSGGNHTLNSATLSVGVFGNVTGSYTLSSGNLTTNSGGEEIGAGINNNGNFTQTGGTNFLNFNSSLSLGFGSGSNGNYSLQAGNLSLSTGSEYIGTNGNGTFTQSGGSHTLLTNTATLYLGDSLGANGIYNLQAGNLSVAGTEYVGYFGNGTVTQSGGNHTVATTLDVGSQSTSNGNYTLNNASGTSLLTVLTEIVGDSGHGTFTQSNGTNTVTSGLFIGNNGIGLYYLQNGNLSAPSEYIGSSGNGTFLQSGGTNTVSGFMEIATYLSSTASYQLNAGNLTLTAGASLAVGDDGTATFQQFGGNNTISGSLQIGTAFQGAPGNSSSYLLNGGNLTVAQGEFVGDGNFANFTQTAGVNTANSPGLILTVNPAYPGVYNLKGGTLNTTAIDVNGNPSYFKWTGGTLNLTAGITFDPSASPTSTSAAFGSSLTLNSGMNLITTSETVGGAGLFTLTLNAGSSDTAPAGITIASTGTLNQAGGAISATVNNQGFFIFSGGTFTGEFVNFGTANISLAFAPTTGIWNLGTLNLSPLSGSISVYGASIINQGSIALAGGSLAGSSINNLGLISGFGGINFPGLVNSGTITQSGGSLFIASPTTGFINSGTLNLAPGLTTFLTGAANAANDGTINLNAGTLCDNSSNPIVTLTNNADGILLGPGKIYGPFINNGSVQPGNGTLTLTQAWTNSGSVTLSGPASALAGGAITNNASIQGAGTVTAAVTNNGSIEATSGTLLFAGALTNAATGTLRASTGNKILVQGSFPTNPGILSLTGGTFDNGGNPLTNTGQITGFGTLATGGLTNNGTITFTGGTATINGPVTNSAGKTILIKNDPAVFTGNITNNGTIKTTNTIVTFTGTYTGNAYISDPSTNIFQNNVTVSGGGSMTGGVGDVFIFASGIVTNNGNFTNGGTLDSSDNTTNNATFTQTGPQSWANGTTFTNIAPGVATFASDTGSASASPLNINVTGGTVNLSATQHLSSLTITGGKTAITTGTTKTNAFTLGGSTNAWTGQLELGANKFLVEAPINKPAVLAAIQNQAVYGRTHSTGITSAALPAHTAIAVIDNAALATPFSTFGGVSADANSILVAPELLGDLNIDGHVDNTDLTLLLNNFGSTTQAWTSGNFDGQSTINLTDLSYVLNNFGMSYANASDAPAGGPISAPEPRSLALLLPAALLVKGRRSRSRSAVGVSISIAGDIL